MTMERYDVRVTAVRDGDSFAGRVGSELREFRLSGLNAPDREDGFGYTPSKDYLSLLIGRKTVRVIDTGRGHYGRRLVIVIIKSDKGDNIRVNDKMKIFIGKIKAIRGLLRLPPLKRG